MAVVIGREKIVLKGNRINAGEVFFFTSISDNMCVGFFVFVFVFLRKKKKRSDPAITLSYLAKCLYDTILMVFLKWAEDLTD